jgi:AraC-like DNA-binding protein
MGEQAENNVKKWSSIRRQSISITKLKNVISEAMRSRDPTLPAVAALLKTSPRSLQRRLEIQAITYSDVVDEVRYEISRTLLANTDLDVAEISATLGYKDPSSFSRAFMRWSGVSPREYRGTHLAAAK